MIHQTSQTQHDPDPITAEIHAVAREARRIATEGATSEEREVFNARRRVVLDQIQQYPEAGHGIPVVDLMIPPAPVSSDTPEPTVNTVADDVSGAEKSAPEPTVNTETGEVSDREVALMDELQDLAKRLDAADLRRLVDRARVLRVEQEGR